ncbi:major facilitator superfamily domain-containing protein [Jimgerdemannia flammicorona]|uniref:Major facilitator superfamily domain-containing protein n=1 Tax=Jimgerdemannia flammicorona TaxID=994334 RepID=A0A433QPB0_9FUNG|nr:major facilitator superfamily domain-containing protein [Jimgerdemannia flammicorona]
MTTSLLDHSLALAMFVGALNSTVIAPALPIIADIFGRKAILLFCLIVFTLTSMGCALSVNMTMLIFMRAAQGLGGGGLMSTVLIIIADIYPIDQRAKYQGIATSTFGLASVVGPLLGGALVDRLNWRWAFWVTPIFATPALVVVTFFFNLKHQRSSTMEKLKRVDFSGTFLEVIGITCLMLGINWGGTKYDWNSAPIISLLIISFILLSAFIYVEGYRAVEPIIPFRLFKKATIVASFVSNFFVGMNFFALLYFFPWLAEVGSVLIFISISLGSSSRYNNEWFSYP